MSSQSMDETYGQQIHLHLLNICMQLATICQKLQLKWSPTLHCHVTQIVHIENMKINNK
jgi:hypothetical protein